MTSGSLGGVIVSTQVQNTRDVVSILALGAIFSIFITPNETGCHDHNLVRIGQGLVYSSVRII